MSRRALLLVLALVVGLATTLAATVATPANAAELPRTAARRTVESSVHAAYPNLTFGNVACPAGVKRARGVSFTCTVQLPGTFLVVDAKQTDGSGTIALSTQQALIPTQSLRDFVAQNASLPATVDCGPGPFRVARAGQTIDCPTVLADGTTRTVQLTVQDTAGNVTLSAVN
ncbi:MAG TPA: DUF4333 domain-containing protein [Acidimicrobiia bacterium]